MRCLGVQEDGSVRIFCLDHGCRCTLGSDTDLCLPTAPNARLLMSGMPFFTATLRLALLPPHAGDNDFVMRSEELRRLVRGLCEKNAPFVARHDSLMSEVLS